MNCAAGSRAALVVLAAVVTAACGGTAPSPVPAAAPAGAAPKPAAAPASPTPVAVAVPKDKDGAPLPLMAYDSKGRRDPFAPIVLAKEETRPLNLGPVKLVGIVQGRTSLLALVETPDGLGYILKPGDVLGEGQVANISPRSVTFMLASRSSRQVASLTLKLVSD